MDKQTLIRNFSRYAHLYDRYADVQRLLAVKLLSRIKNTNPDKILELGCGTGNYTLLLREKFKDAQITAVDISKEMIAVARSKINENHIKFIVSDAEKHDFSEKFDLITSNACFQWFADLERALLRYKNLLKKNSVISFSIFGPDTFRGLGALLKYKSENASVSADNFIAGEKIKKILKQNFRKAQVKEFTYRESFACLKDLLDKIKYTGARGEGLSGRAYLNRQILSAPVKATYQVFLCGAYS